MTGPEVAALLAPIRSRNATASTYDDWHQVGRDGRALLAAVEAVLDQADDLMRKSEALDAEAEYIAGEHPEAAAVAVLKRERSIAYDECARWFREAIASALNGDSGPQPDSRETCWFWDIRAGECRYEMLFLGCEPCAACPG